MSSTFVRFAGFTILVLALLVGALRLTCLRWWRVPVDDPDLAASIAPTLSPGDWVILWRMTPPGFGDLALCPDPEEPGQVFLGRVAGEPGDTIKIDEAGALTINNSRVRSEHACELPTFTVEHPRSGEEIELRCDIEALGGVHHMRALVPPQGTPKPAPLTRHVEPDEVFLVSDNRYLPFDSRDFGALPRDSCRESVIFRLVSRLGFSHVRSRLRWIQ